VVVRPGLFLSSWSHAFPNRLGALLASSLTLRASA
jgi:hypothetical protein